MKERAETVENAGKQEESCRVGWDVRGVALRKIIVRAGALRGRKSGGSAPLEGVAEDGLAG